VSATVAGRDSLVAVTHGALHPTGVRTVEAVLQRVRQRLPGVLVRPAYVGPSYVALPDARRAKGGHGRSGLVDVLVEQTGPAIVVPLLLTVGSTALSGVAQRPHVVAGSLGSDRLLTEVMAHRLRLGGVRPGQPVVVVAAGSPDAASSGDTARTARLLSDLWGGPVRAAHLTGCGPRLSEVAAELRAEGLAPPAVAPYLIAEGHHYRKAREDARALGLGTVVEPLGDHPLVTEAVVRRYRAAAAHRFALSLC
jgi:sirohydrochlorin ferrochelatase